MPTEAIEYRISITGGEEAARIIAAIKQATEGSTKATEDNTGANNRAKTALTAAEREAAKLAKAQAQMAQHSTAAAAAAQSASVKFNTFGSTLGLAGQAIGRLNPMAGQMVSTLGQASGAIETLSTSALGPLGIALGAATAAFGIISAAVAAFDDDVEESAQTIRDTAIPTLDDYISKLNSARSRAARNTLLDQGGGTGVDQEARRQETRNRILTTEEQINGLLAQQTRTGDRLNATDQGRLNALEGQRVALRYQLETQNELVTNAQRNDNLVTANARALAEIEAAKDEAEGNGTLRDRPSGGRRSDGITARQEAIALTQKANALAALELSLLQEEEDARVRVAQKLQDQLAALDALNEAKLVGNKLAETQRRAEEEAAASAAADAVGEKNKERANAADLRAIEEAERQQAAWNETIESGKKTLAGFGTTAASAFAEAIAAGGNLGDAFAAAIDQKLEALAISETVEGFAALATAVGSFWNPPLAAAKGTEAALHFAAAGIAGGISAAIPNAAAPAGGSGSSGDSARPERSGGGSGSGEQTIVINFGGDVVTAATQADLGRQISRMIDSGNSRLGRG